VQIKNARMLGENFGVGTEWRVPEGPGGYVRFAVSDAVAETMIDTIRAGRPLPDDLLEQLPIAEFG
jgi:hypothetical protein